SQGWRPGLPSAAAPRLKTLLLRAPEGRRTVARGASPGSAIECREPQPRAPVMIDLSVSLGRLALRNPILVASGTFGYAREMAGRVGEAGQGLAGLELNLSCPNVSGGLDFATDPELTRRIVRRCRDACPGLPLVAKLTPNVTDIRAIAKAAADGGADAVSAVNTFVGMAIDWRRRKPIL